jgi:hypothetical protein
MNDDFDSSEPAPRRRPRRPGRAPDPVERDFGPGAKEEPAAPGAAASPASGPVPGLACGGENCLLRPVAGLVGRFGVSLAGRAALGRAAFSGVEMMKALRDFLDEEIAMVERAAGKGDGAPRYEKIRVE